jgi:transposase
VERKTLFISTGKDNKTVVNFVEELESKQVNCDMLPAFIKGVKENLPQAEITSQLAPMVKVTKTIKRHWDDILNWKKSQINNGILEGLNSVLQAQKEK